MQKKLTFTFFSNHKSTFPSKSHKFPLPHHDFPSISPSRTLHFPSLSSKITTTISLPQNPPKSTEISPLSPPRKTPPPPQRPPNAEFQEKMLYLDSIGLDIFSLADHHRPIILSASLVDVKSVVDLFISMDFNSAEFRRIISMCPEILISNASTILPIFTFLLREARVKGSDIKHVIHRRPRLLVSSVKHRLRPTMYFLQSIGIEEVADLVGRQGWRLPDPSDELIEQDWHVVKQIQIYPNERDRIVWKGNNKGQFTVATAYKALMPTQVIVGWWKVVWGHQFIPRHSFILWIALKNRLNVKTRIAVWANLINQLCCLCGQEEETVPHLFFYCSVSGSVWMEISGKCDVPNNLPWRKLISWLSRNAAGKSLKSSIRRVAFAATVYWVWLTRNRIAFDNGLFCKDQIVRQVSLNVKMRLCKSQSSSLLWNKWT
ncbi:uncharacterized protein [Euphorbia lathyris]|uniref:uncharacterized protein n=1 Tax=Euphorbia lathyris TaxID=212925 RepID=UPI00331412DE